MREVIQQKLADSLAYSIPKLTLRSARVPAIPGKAHAVIGMRRAGKTYFLFQQMLARLQSGAERDTLVYFNFEDERLAGLEAGQLSILIEEYYLRFPEYRDRVSATLLLDEIQIVPGWETFVRRMLDTEKLEVFVSGSSARMLSREIATSLRGRATETVVFPYAFAEFLTHHQIEVPTDVNLIPKGLRSRLASAFEAYLCQGGFPEAQSLEDRDRIGLLQGYVDVVILRDVAERHGIGNLTALRALVRQLLNAGGAKLSIHKLANDLHSQGIPVSKDSLHQMLAHLEDAFLVKAIPLHTSSERQRQSNPRKVYPIDHSLFAAFDRSGKRNLGATLEIVVAMELERRGWTFGYGITTSGYEVDFMARDHEGGSWAIQVVADPTQPNVLERELRSLRELGANDAGVRCLLLTLTDVDASTRSHVSAPIETRPVWQWCLDP